MKPAYPRVSEIIEEELSRLARAGGKPVSLRAVASETQLSVPALSSWKRGERAPRRDNIRRLAAFFYPDAAHESERGRFVTRLLEAATQPTSVSGRSTVDSLLEDFRIGVVEYGPFANADDPATFLTGMMDRFTRESGITPNFQAAAIHEAGESLKSGKYHLVLSLLATPDRSVRIKFFHTPVSVSVNAVILRRDLPSETEPRREFESALRRALTPRATTVPHETVTALIHPDEVGGLYTRISLDFDRVPAYIQRLERYSIEEYADKLLSGRGKGGTKLVAIIDEFACLQLLDRLNGEGHLVFPLAESSNAMMHSRSARPIYPLSVGINRDEPALSEFLSELLTLFLMCDFEHVAWLYTRLYQELVDTAVKGLRADGGNPSADPEGDASTWAGRVLRLDLPQYAPSSEWERIILRAQDLIYEETGRDFRAGRSRAGPEAQ